MSDRRDHNHGQIVAFLDAHYPNSMPGSPDRDQMFDDNKKTSRVILKGGAWKRADSALGGKDGRGNTVDRELSRSYALLLRLFEAVPARLDDAAPGRRAPKKARDRSTRKVRVDLYRQATRNVLLNTNTAGGHEELERLGKLGRTDPAARVVAGMCREVIAGVLDELDGMGYWLGWGTDEDVFGRREAVAARRTEGPEADGGAIAAYHELMARSYPEANVREYLTAQHFGISMRTVRRAVKAEEAKAS